MNKNIEMHIIPDPNKSYLRHDEVISEKPLVGLRQMNPDFILTKEFIGRAFVRNKNTGESFFIPRGISSGFVLETSIVNGHDLLQTLQPLRCNHFGVTTNLTEN